MCTIVHTQLRCQGSMTCKRQSHEWTFEFAIANMPSLDLICGISSATLDQRFKESRVVSKEISMIRSCVDVALLQSYEKYPKNPFRRYENRNF